MTTFATPPLDAAQAAQAALDAFGSCIALFDPGAATLRWTSRAWRRLSPAPAAGALQAAIEPLRARLSCGAALHTTLPIGARSMALELAPTDDPTLLALWLHEQPALARAEPGSRETQRHLEDRERLLFTSRSISIGEMAVTLAHEINQPLGSVANVLRGVLARLEPHQQTGPDAALFDHLQQGVRLALDQALYAARVVGRIREFTQARAPQFEPVDMHTLLRDSLTLLDWEFSRHHVQVATSGGESLHGRVVGDAVMLQQVLVNLLRNALDAVRERAAGDARIVVSVQHGPAGLARDEIEITIADNGSGLSEQAEALLFVPFQSSKPTGMGIGLNICRSFVELHQGRLWFTRNPPAEGGCSFHVALPLIRPGAAQAVSTGL